MLQCAAVCLLVIFATATGNVLDNAEFADEASRHSLAHRRRYAMTFVDCYSCVNCGQVNKDTLVKSCPYTPDVIKAKICVKYEEKYRKPVDGKNNSWVNRGCASEKGSCAEIKKASEVNTDLLVDLEYCTECDGDKCNGVSRSLSDMFVAVVAVIFVPIFGKFVAS